MIKTIKALAVRRRAELQFGLPVLFFLRSKYLSTGRRQGRPLLTVSSQSCLKLKCWACSFRSAMQWLTFLFLVPSALSSPLRCVLYQCLQLRIDSWNHQVVKPPHRNFCNVSSVCLNCVLIFSFANAGSRHLAPFPGIELPSMILTLVPAACFCFTAWTDELKRASTSFHKWTWQICVYATLRRRDLEAALSVDAIFTEAFHTLSAAYRWSSGGI